MPVRAVTTAEPPVNNMAVTRMLVINPKTMKTRWAGVPYLALITSRKVYSMLVSCSFNWSWKRTHVGIRCSALQLNRNGRKQDNLDGGSRGIPEWSGYTITICDTRRLEKSSSPCPGRTDGGSNKTRLDCTPSSTEHLRSLKLMVVTLEDPCDENLDEVSMIFKLVGGKSLPCQKQKHLRVQGRFHNPIQHQGEEQYLKAS